MSNVFDQIKALIPEERHAEFMGIVLKHTDFNSQAVDVRGKVVTEITYMACSVTECKYNDLFVADRHTNVVDARTLISEYLVRKKRWRLTDVGKYLHKNHATIISMLKRHDSLLQFDKGYQNVFNLFQQKVSEYEKNNQKFESYLQNGSADTATTTLDILRHRAYNH